MHDEISDMLSPLTRAENVRKKALHEQRERIHSLYQRHQRVSGYDASNVKRDFDQDAKAMACTSAQMNDYDSQGEHEEEVSFMQSARKWLERSSTKKKSAKPKSTRFSSFKKPDGSYQSEEKFKSSYNDNTDDTGTSMDTPYANWSMPNSVDLGNRNANKHSQEHHTYAETVEGSDILHTLLVTSTPRYGRKFNSERDTVEARKLSYSSDSASESDHRNEVTRNCNIDEPTEEKHIGSNISRRKRYVREDEAWSDAVFAKNKYEGDAETEIRKWRELHGVQLSYYIAWFAIAFLGFCVIIASYPLLKTYWTPLKPYCNTSESDYAFMLSSHASKRQNVVHSTALTLYHTDPGCRRCPLYGICSNGSLRNCVLPYELRRGSCVESSAIERELQKLAISIRDFLISQATLRTCNITLFEFIWDIRDIKKKVALNATPVSLDLIRSHIQGAVKAIARDNTADTSSYHKRPSLALLSPDYLLRRAIDLAASSLLGVTILMDEHKVLVPRTIIPFICRAKIQLFAYSKLLAGILFLLMLLAIARQRYALYQTEHALVERLCREVRHFLYSRAAEAGKRRQYSSVMEAFYSVELLRNHILDTHSESKNLRKWMGRVIWPKVENIARKDGHIDKKILNIYGKDTEVWEWNQGAAEFDEPGLHKHAGSSIRTPRQRNQYNVTDYTDSYQPTKSTAFSTPTRQTTSRDDHSRFKCCNFRSIWSPLQSRFPAAIKAETPIDIKRERLYLRSQAVADEATKRLHAQYEAACGSNRTSDLNYNFS